MPSPNEVILAAAGSRKTEHVVERALGAGDSRVLITTYTNENRRQITRRIEEKVGVVPSNIMIMGWFSFLVTQWIKPYQRALTGEPLVVANLNFHGRRNRFAEKKKVFGYFLDTGKNVYRDEAASFACALNSTNEGKVVARLEKIYDLVLIDEVQDLVGYDLDVLDLLFASDIEIVAVGDPRQHTLSTNIGSRNAKYRGVGLSNWLDERADLCTVGTRSENYRCNQEICEFADAIYPDMPRTTSVGVGTTGHDGVIVIPLADVLDYAAAYPDAQVLRDSKNFDTAGLPAMNIGVAKGSTFDRVIIFPTRPMLQYLDDGDPTKLRAPERLYVAVTRARYSVAFVRP